MQLGPLVRDHDDIVGDRCTIQQQVLRRGLRRGERPDAVAGRNRSPGAGTDQNKRLLLNDWGAIRAGTRGAAEGDHPDNR
jgi:hypothetical protein